MVSQPSDKRQREPRAVYHGAVTRPDIDSAASWFSRAAKYLSPGDFLRFNPYEAVRTLWSFLRSAQKGQMSVSPDGQPDDDPDVRDPEFVALAMELIRAVGRHYFRLEVRGAAHLPPSGAALIVGNHNGGILPIDSLLTIAAVFDHCGPERAVHPLAHDILFHSELLRDHARRFGALRASHHSAERAFVRGRMVLVYPGSDRDIFRPFHQRGRVELAGRKGFLRLALRNRVPIVPVVTAGTHEQLVVLARGDAVVRALGLKRRLRIEAFPLVFALPWGLTSGYFPYLPLPAQTTLSFGPPLSFPDVRPDQADDPQVLARCYAQVIAAMQSQLDDLMKDRVPFLGPRRG